MTTTATPAAVATLVAAMAAQFDATQAAIADEAAVFLDKAIRGVLTTDEALTELATLFDKVENFGKAKGLIEGFNMARGKPPVDAAVPAIETA